MTEQRGTAQHQVPFIRHESQLNSSSPCLSSSQSSHHLPRLSSSLDPLFFLVTTRLLLFLLVIHTSTYKYLLTCGKTQFVTQFAKQNKPNFNNLMTLLQYSGLQFVSTGLQRIYTNIDFYKQNKSLGSNADVEPWK